MALHGQRSETIGPKGDPREVIGLHNGIWMERTWKENKSRRVRVRKCGKQPITSQYKMRFTLLEKDFRNKPRETHCIALVN